MFCLQFNKTAIIINVICYEGTSLTHAHYNNTINSSMIFATIWFLCQLFTKFEKLFCMIQFCSVSVLFSATLRKILSIKYNVRNYSH